MKPSKIKLALKVCLEADQPVMLWSPPGNGKSSIVYQVANDVKRAVYEIRATLLDPVDLRGLMRIENGRTVWCPPIFLPDVENTIVFIDELPTAPPLVQAALYQLILDRKLGEYVLPKGTRIIAAGNRETDRAAVHRMPTPLANRFTHLDLEFDNKDWEKWLIDNDMPIELVAWNRFKPSRISAFNPLSTEKAQPTPRSWAFIAKFLDVTRDKFLLFELIKGTVGQSDALEFCAFIDDWKILPDPIKILKDPSKGEVPSKASVLFSLCAALAKLVNMTYIDNLFVYAERLSKEGFIDHAMAMIDDTITRDPNLKESGGYISWITNNGHLYAS